MDAQTFLMKTIYAYEACVFTLLTLRSVDPTLWPLKILWRS